MEYKRIYIEFDTDYSNTLHWFWPCDGKNSEKADKEIKKHLNDGWKIVSTSPVTASRRMNADGIVAMGMGHESLKHEWEDYVFTFTSGIEVFLVKD